MNMERKGMNIFCGEPESHWVNIFMYVGIKETISSLIVLSKNHYLFTQLNIYRFADELFNPPSINELPYKMTSIMKFKCYFNLVSPIYNIDYPLLMPTPGQFKDQGYQEAIKNEYSMNNNKKETNEKKSSTIHDDDDDDDDDPFEYIGNDICISSNYDVVLNFENSDIGDIDGIDDPFANLDDNDNNRNISNDVFKSIDDKQKCSYGTITIFSWWLMNNYNNQEFNDNKKQHLYQIIKYLVHIKHATFTEIFSLDLIVSINNPSLLGFIIAVFICIIHDQKIKGHKYKDLIISFIGRLFKRWGIKQYDNNSKSNLPLLEGKQLFKETAKHLRDNNVTKEFGCIATELDVAFDIWQDKGMELFIPECNKLEILSDIKNFLISSMNLK